MTIETKELVISEELKRKVEMICKNMSQNNYNKNERKEIPTFKLC